MIRLLTDPDVLMLKPPRDAAYEQNLKSDLMQNGCVNPILTWKGIIIDGHKRHKACLELNVPFSVTQKDFYSKNEAIVYACELELHQDDLPEPFRKYLLGKLVRAGTALAAEKYLAANPDLSLTAGGLLPHGAVRKGDVIAEIMEKHGSKRTTMNSYENFSIQIDDVRRKDFKLAEDILAERIHVSLKLVTELSRMPADELRTFSAMLAEENETQVTLARIKAAKG